MRTNTGAALRVVDEIDDPKEVAQREAEQVTAEKAEIVAKLQELRASKAEVDAIVASGDHRRITDDLLERGAKCERGIAAMEKALEIAEARRIAAEERVSAIARARAAKSAEIEGEELRKKIDAATDALTPAFHVLGGAIRDRRVVLEEAERYNATAATYGLVLLVTAPSTKEILDRLAVATGLYVGDRQAVGAIFVR